MRGEGFLARCLRGRCCTQSTDFLALVWSLVLHAPRRHCLEALYKTQDQLEMRQMPRCQNMIRSRRCHSAEFGGLGSEHGRRPNRMPRTRRSWIGRSVNCNQENVAEAAAHRSLPLGVASIRPFLSNLLQWVPRRHESSFHSSKGEPTAVYGVQCQPASATAVYQVPGI